jgi:hypothetical protein
MNGFRFDDTPTELLEKYMTIDANASTFALTLDELIKMAGNGELSEYDVVYLAEYAALMSSWFSVMLADYAQTVYAEGAAAPSDDEIQRVLFSVAVVEQTNPEVSFNSETPANYIKTIESARNAALKAIAQYEQDEPCQDS